MDDTFIDDMLDEKDYDPGLLNDFGGGNVQWWQDYLRAEINACNEYWRTLIMSYMNDEEDE